MKRHLGLIPFVLCVVLVVSALSACDPTMVKPLTVLPPSSCALQSSNTTVVQAESKFISSFASVPFTGAAIVTNGVFSNIYLWPNPGSQTWDQHLASLTTNANSNETSEVLDQITCALVHSSYFDALTQYGIAPPVFAGDETTIQSCADSVMANASANAGVIQWGAIKDFVNCEESAPGPKTTQVNVILSPDLKVAEFNLNQAPDLCTTGSSAYHWAWPGTRNYSVIPTSTECSDSIAKLTQDISHEMVETISDPGGFGWLHETIPGRALNPPEDLEHQYNEGELGDICSSRGLHPTQPVPFDVPSAGVGTLSVASYWSNADNTCEPKFIMNRTLAAKTGNPIVRFTGDLHEVTVPVSIGRDADGAFQALEIEITTGSDDLRGGSSLGDNATVVLHLRSGQSFTITNINESNEWGNGTLHSAFLSFPPGIAASDITSITLQTDFSGGIDGDNWNVNGIILKAAVGPQAGCPLTSVTLVSAPANTTLPDGSTGLVRMTGSVHQWSIPISFTGAQSNQLISGLQLTIETGDDDLRGGGSLADNANAIVSLASGQSVTFTNINGFGTWTDFSTASVPLLALNALPPNTTVGDITGLTLETNFSGGLNGDNWDIASVALQASAGCVSTGPTPVESTITLVDATGNATLPDGSIGLIRMTGDVHDWTTSVTVPSGDAGDTLVGLQLTIVTGNDDLRGGNQPSDNADAIVQFASVGTVTFPNINQSQHWQNGQTVTVTLNPVPSSTTVGEIQSLTIHTAFTGGINGDNWDISRVVLTATVMH